jgi:hypothetical protein
MVAVSMALQLSAALKVGVWLQTQNVSSDTTEASSVSQESVGLM